MRGDSKTKVPKISLYLFFSLKRRNNLKNENSLPKYSLERNNESSIDLSSLPRTIIKIIGPRIDAWGTPITDLP